MNAAAVTPGFLPIMSLWQWPAILILGLCYIGCQKTPPKAPYTTSTPAPQTVEPPAPTRNCYGGPVQTWPHTIVLKDHRRGPKKVDVATITLQASTMSEPTSPGKPISPPTDSIAPILDFAGSEQGYINLKVTKIDWSLCKEYDGSANYKITARNLWVTMSPMTWTGRYNEDSATVARRRAITAPNIEYQKGDSLPPSAIFKVIRDGCYTLTLGFRAITPLTTDEKPEEFNFYFDVQGIETQRGEEIGGSDCLGLPASGGSTAFGK